MISSMNFPTDEALQKVSHLKVTAMNLARKNPVRAAFHFREIVKSVLNSDLNHGKVITDSYMTNGFQYPSAIPNRENVGVMSSSRFSSFDKSDDSYHISSSSVRHHEQAVADPDSTSVGFTRQRTSVALVPSSASGIESSTSVTVARPKKNIKNYDSVTLKNWTVHCKQSKLIIAGVPVSNRKKSVANEFQALVTVRLGDNLVKTSSGICSLQGPPIFDSNVPEFVANSFKTGFVKKWRVLARDWTLWLEKKNSENSVHQEETGNKENEVSQVSWTPHQLVTSIVKPLRHHPHFSPTLNVSIEEPPVPSFLSSCEDIKSVGSQVPRRMAKPEKKEAKNTKKNSRLPVKNQLAPKMKKNVEKAKAALLNRKITSTPEIVKKMVRGQVASVGFSSGEEEDDDDDESF